MYSINKNARPATKLLHVLINTKENLVEKTQLWYKIKSAISHTTKYVYGYKNCSHGIKLTYDHV